MPAYFDHAATSPLRPEALAAMLPYLTEHFGNPSGSHTLARRARDAVEQARESVARNLGCSPGEVVFTSGGTEACNLAVLGAHAVAGGEVRCSAFEHHAVLDTCLSVGSGASTVPVGADGLVDLDGLADALHPGVGLVSLMLANNEVGTIQPLAEAVRLVRELAPDALVHSDAVAAGAWLGPERSAVAGGADLVSLAAHKFGGPKGVGALVVRSGVRLGRVLHGGPQERERRPGTHDVAAIVGMAAALDVAALGRSEEWAAVAARRDRLARGLVDSVAGLTLTAPGSPKLPGSCHLRIGGIHQEELLVLLDDAGVCASAGSACASGAMEPSHVLVAMGMSPGEASEAVRFSLGWTTSDDDVDVALGAVAKSVERLRRS